MRASELHRLARVLREIALEATGNTGADRVNAGQLAVLEDVARHPRSTIGDITERTGLAQSLVSRIVHAAATDHALTVEQDETDRRRVRVELAGEVREAILDRSRNSTEDAIATYTPHLGAEDRERLGHHLEEAAALLRQGAWS